MVLLFSRAAEAAATDCFCYLIIIIHRQVIVKNTLGNALARKFDSCKSKKTLKAA